MDETLTPLESQRSDLVRQLEILDQQLDDKALGKVLKLFYQNNQVLRNFAIFFSRVFFYKYQ